MEVLNEWINKKRLSGRIESIEIIDPGEAITKTLVLKGFVKFRYEEENFTKSYEIVKAIPYYFGPSSEHDDVEKGNKELLRSFIDEVESLISQKEDAILIEVGDKYKS